MAKADLSKATIVDRALDVADTEGLDAVTIRRLGQEFGVTPMALYWHVKNKDELLDAMGDRLFETVDYTVGPDASWDESLAAVVRGVVDAFRRHPVCVDLAYRRVFACEEGRRLAEHTLGLLREAGFSRSQTADIATRSLQTALMLVSSEPGAEPGMTADDVHAALAAKRAALELLPADEFPYIREMAGDMLQCDDIEGYYDFNVELFVAGAKATLAAGDLAGRSRSNARSAARSATETGSVRKARRATETATKSAAKAATKPAAKAAGKPAAKASARTRAQSSA